MAAQQTISLDGYLANAARASWAAVGELAEVVPIEQWLVVGGQMVTIHAARHGVARHRVTTDADIVVDVRAARRSAMVRAAEALVAAGFEARSSLDGVSRFIRGSAVIDLLAPEGLRGPVMTIGASHAVAAPGATQALHRAQTVAVGWDDHVVTVRCPTLLGAIVAKAAAVAEVVSMPDPIRLKHQLDLILLLELAARFELPAARDLSAKDRRRLRAAMAVPLGDPRHRAWAAAEHPGDVREVVERLGGGFA